VALLALVNQGAQAVNRHFWIVSVLADHSLSPANAEVGSVLGKHHRWLPSG
jgi:hypothetical protein